MKKYKQLILGILISCLALLFIFCSCSNQNEKPVLRQGKYYLEGTEDIYIEIINDEKIDFIGVDFTWVDAEKLWGDSWLWEEFDNKNFDPVEAMQGERNYIYWEDLEITFEIIEGSGFSLVAYYNGIDTIRLHKLNYIYKAVAIE